LQRDQDADDNECEFDSHGEPILSPEGAGEPVKDHGLSGPRSGMVPWTPIARSG